MTGSSAYADPNNPADAGYCFSCQVPKDKQAILSFKDISVLVEVKGKERLILNKVSGIVKPTEVLAILGPSGCGKSTLLDTLAGRIHGVKDVGGRILVNGQDMSLAYGTAAYVPQQDVLVGTLTVRETLMYSARLRLPASTPRKQIEDTVDMIISDLGLDVCKNTYVGAWGIRGISGGQKRRVSIGVELVTSPRLIFLDEPTSGLDSASSFYVMVAVRRLAHEGRTIAATIHQPNSEVFGLFDKLMLLSEGRTVYFGKASNALAHFEKAGLPCPPHQPPADHYLRSINKDFAEVQNDDPEAKQAFNEMEDIEEAKGAPKNVVNSMQESVNLLCTLLQESPEYKGVLADIEMQINNPAHAFSKNQEPSILRATPILIERNFKNLLRNVFYVWLRLIMYLGLSICLGTLYINLTESYNDVFNRLAILFFSVGFLTFMVIAAVPALIDDVQVFMRERYNGYYGVASFTLANTLASLPFLFLVALVASICTYWIAGLRETGEFFFKYVTILFLSLTVTESLFMLLAAVVQNFLLVMGAGAGIMGIFMLVCGFFIAEPDIPGPVWKYPLHYIAFHTYSYGAFMNNEFRGDRSFACPPIPFPLPGVCMDAVSQCRLTGDMILKQNGIKNKTFGFNIGILILMTGGYRIIFFLYLKYQEYKRTKSGAKAKTQ